KQCRERRSPRLPGPRPRRSAFESNRDPPVVEEPLDRREQRGEQHEVYPRFAAKPEREPFDPARLRVAELELLYRFESAFHRIREVAREQSRWRILGARAELVDAGAITEEHRAALFCRDFVRFPLRILDPGDRSALRDRDAPNVTRLKAAEIG